MRFRYNGLTAANYRNTASFNPTVSKRVQRYPRPRVEHRKLKRATRENGRGPSCPVCCERSLARGNSAAGVICIDDTGRINIRELHDQVNFRDFEALGLFQMDVRQFLPPLGQFLDFCYCRGIGGMDNRLKCEVCFLSNDAGHERRCPLGELSFRRNLVPPVFAWQENYS